MTKHLIALTAACGLLAGAGTGALAQNSNAPGIQMQEKGSVKGTTGASGYAPGQVDTGTSVDTDADVKAGGAKIRGGADAKVKIK
jgi:hypothetical protein